jgi:hypothetical protein
VNDGNGQRHVNTRARTPNPFANDLLSSPDSIISASTEGIDALNNSHNPPNLHPNLPVLNFKANTATIDSLTLSYDKVCPKDDHHQFAPTVKNLVFNRVWICDASSHHCGTLTGLNFWPPHNSLPVLDYELILLSRCYQKVVTEEDIRSNLDKLPLEYPNSEEYYDELFHTCYYTPTEKWAANVILLEWKGEYAARVAVGQIDADALRQDYSGGQILSLARTLKRITLRVA